MVSVSDIKVTINQKLIDLYNVRILFSSALCWTMSLFTLGTLIVCSFSASPQYPSHPLLFASTLAFVSGSVYCYYTRQVFELFEKEK